MTTTGALSSTVLFLQVDIAGTWTSIGGQLSYTVTLNNQLIDITNKVGSAGYRELLAGEGVQSIDTTMDMIFVSQAGYDHVRSKAGTEEQMLFRVLSNGLEDTSFTGQIASFSDTSEDGAALKGTITIHSTGEVRLVGSPDENFSSVSALLSLDGADGSNTIINSGPGPNRVGFTAQGTAQLDTAIKKFGTASLLLDGNSDYLVADNAAADWNFLHNGTAFTVELWVYPTGATTGVLLSTGSQSGGYRGFVLTHNPWDTVTLSVSTGSQGFGLSTTAVVPSSTWTHIAVTFVPPNVNRIFVNGVLNKTYTNLSFGLSAQVAATTLNIGRDGVFNTGHFTGHMDDIRITKGVARYTSSFTPPTEAYT